MEATYSEIENLKDEISRILDATFSIELSTNELGFFEADSPESLAKTNRVLVYALIKLTTETREKFIKLVEESNKRIEDLTNEIKTLRSVIDELEKARTRKFKVPESWVLDEEI